MMVDDLTRGMEAPGEKTPPKPGLEEYHRLIHSEFDWLCARRECAAEPWHTCKFMVRVGKKLLCPLTFLQLPGPLWAGIPEL